MPELIGRGWQVYLMVAVGLAIIYLLPRLTRAVPSPPAIEVGRARGWREARASLFGGGVADTPLPPVR